MGLFSRKIPVTATAGTAAVGTAAGALIAAGHTMAGRDRAMRIPTISRSRDLLCSLVASLPIRNYAGQWNGNEIELMPIPPEAWMTRPDPRTTRAHFLAWLTDGLMFYGRAYAYVTARRALDGRPASFQLLDPESVDLSAEAFVGNVPVGDYRLTYLGQTLPNRDVIVFYSPIPALLDVGARSILIAERLDSAALRFASSPTAFGWLQQKGASEALSDEDLSDLASGWADVRDQNAVGALNNLVEWVESGMDPSRLQLVEARQYASLDMARLANVPPYLVGAPAGTGMTYQNAETARADAVTFGALPYIEAIEATLSGEEITPRGHVVRLDRSAWIPPAIRTDQMPEPAAQIGTNV